MKIFKWIFLFAVIAHALDSHNLGLALDLDLNQVSGAVYVVFADIAISVRAEPEPDLKYHNIARLPAPSRRMLTQHLGKSFTARQYAGPACLILFKIVIVVVIKP